MDTENNLTTPPEQKKTILLIEDDVFISQMYALKFKQTPYDLLLARDGSEALAIIKEQKPDLILLDLVLPNADGFTMLKSFKQDQGTKHIPVILLTNLGQPENVQKAMNLGATDYVIKAHHTPQEVVAKVQAALGA